MNVVISYRCDILCRAGRDNFRVMRRIYKFVLQKKKISPRQLPTVADAPQSDKKKRHLWLKKHRLLSEFPGTPPSLHPNCVKTPYFCILGRKDLRDLATSPLALAKSNKPFSLSPHPRVSMFWLTRASDTWTWILRSDSATARNQGLGVEWNG